MLSKSLNHDFTQEKSGTYDDEILEFDFATNFLEISKLCVGGASVYVEDLETIKMSISLFSSSNNFPLSTKIEIEENISSWSFKTRKCF